MKYKYYKTRYERYSPADVFVDLGNLEVYCPIGQHSIRSEDYINDCKEITKDKYIQVSAGLYTPEEYIK